MSKRLRTLLVGLTLAVGLLVGASTVDTPQASAAPSDCVWINDGGRWKCVPEFCYYPTFMVQWFGYPNSRTCVMNHLGYYGYYQ